MISFDQARALLADAVAPLEPVELSLADALGCRIAEPPRSDVNAPPGDVSAMDGYAARHADLTGGQPLPVAFEIQAGSIGEPLPDGTAARIFTGAVLPEGADTVVPQERAKAEVDGAVRLEALALGSHVRARGEVLAAGDPVAEPGDVVNGHRVALLAAAGAHMVTVTRRPQMAVVVTGTEIVPVSQLPGPGQIRNSNGPMLDALVRSAGFQAPLQLTASDTKVALRTALGTAIGAADLVLTSGGVSVGDYDLVPEVVRSLGGEVLFHRISVKPGKPILAARLGDAWLLGLPGNPVSVLAGWRMVARPVAAALAGDRAAFDERPVMAALTEPVEVRGGRTELRPAVLEMGAESSAVRVLSWKGSHDVVTAAGANALARIEAKSSHDAGDVVPCYPLDG
jgi:molybdopterin molybdotransferase